MKKQNNHGEPPVRLQLSTANLTDTDRVMTIQLVMQFAERFNLPQDRLHLEPLMLAFENGISFAREWARLTPEQRCQTEEYYAPLVEELRRGDDMFGASAN